MRDSDVDLYTFERLRGEFGPFATAAADDDLGPPSSLPATLANRRLLIAVEK